MRQSYQESTRQKLWSTAFKKLEVIWSAKTEHKFKIFKDCLPQILLGPSLKLCLK